MRREISKQELTLISQIRTQSLFVIKCQEFIAVYIRISSIDMQILVISFSCYINKRSVLSIFSDESDITERVFQRCVVAIRIECQFNAVSCILNT